MGDVGGGLFERANEAAEFLRSRLGGLEPRIGLVLGSGLGAVAEAVTEAVIVPYREIPHFPQSTVEGHSGRIVAGYLGGASGGGSSSPGVTACR